MKAKLSKDTANEAAVTVVTQDHSVKTDRYISVRAVAELCSVSVPTIWRWTSAGTFPRGRLLGARCCRWSAAEVEAWLASRPLSKIGTTAPEARS
ncbi:MAG: AlpA family phage regulatory protein [Synergistaceae bacterium]|nr:AlpA family phage regulatory protein [Synergistaceae bacterium]